MSRTSAPVRIVGYCRVSTDEQATSGLGLEAQRATIEAEAARRGWQIVAMTVDAGISGKTGFADREGGAQALAAVEAGEADAIVAAKLDRFARSVARFGELAERAIANRWGLVTLDADVDMTSASGALVANVLAAVAEWERRIIGERTKAALAAKKAQGVTLGRPRLLDPAIAEEILTRRGEGATLQAIADELNEAGTLTPTGRQWSPALVRKITMRAA